MKKVLLILSLIFVFNIISADRNSDLISLLSMCANGQYDHSIYAQLESELEKYDSNYNGDSALLLYILLKNDNHEKPYSLDDKEVLQLLTAKCTVEQKNLALEESSIWRLFPCIVETLINLKLPITVMTIMRSYENHLRSCIGYNPDQLARFETVIELLVRNCNDNCILELAQKIKLNEFEPVVDDPTGIKLIFKNEIVARLSKI